jgi:serine protease inhibitor
MRCAKSTLLFLIGVAILQWAKSYGSIEQRVSLKPNLVEKSLIESDNGFGFKLFKEVIEQEKDKNVFISPLSVAMALAMTYNGASGNTQEAMQKTLELNGLAVEEINESYSSLIKSLTQRDPKVRFEIANSIWYRKGWIFEEEFINANKIYFNALVSALDFNNPNAADIINKWVDDNTNGKIKEIVKPPIHPFTVMFLIDAIYFKGMWSDEFDKNLTKDDWFTLPDGKKKPCKMMEKKNKDFQYFENSDFQAISLPYGDGNFSMVIFLPRPEKKIDSLIAQLNKENWNQWTNSLTKHKGVIELPKFTLQYELELSKALTALGMGVAFSPGGADFTKMYEGPESLFISKVKHKTFVRVDEEGTEAAAVTSVEMEITSAGPSGFFMRVDRPFVFGIRENKYGVIIFLGKILEPTTE